MDGDDGKITFGYYSSQENVDKVISLLSTKVTSSYTSSFYFKPIISQILEENVQSATEVARRILSS